MTATGMSTSLDPMDVDDGIAPDLGDARGSRGGSASWRAREHLLDLASHSALPPVAQPLPTPPPPPAATAPPPAPRTSHRRSRFIPIPRGAVVAPVRSHPFLPAPAAASGFVSAFLEGPHFEYSGWAPKADMGSSSLWDCWPPGSSSAGKAPTRQRNIERKRIGRQGLGLKYVLHRENGQQFGRPSRELISGAEKIVLSELDRGRYLELDRSSELVRSTISIAFSCDGKFFASTHGDHTVKVLEFPTGDIKTTLEGHPRTPWTVRFHPTDPAILATGCLGSEVRIWNHVTGKCLCRHTFAASISCLSFSPDGELLAITSGNNLMLWAWTKCNVDDRFSSETPRSVTETRLKVMLAGGYATDGVPHLLLRGTMPFYCCDFHPSGKMILVGEKNNVGSQVPDANTGGSSSRDDQFTLNVVVHRFNVRVGVDFDAPVLTVPRVVAYNDAGIHFSPCGTMLLACIPMPEPLADAEHLFRIAILSLVDNGKDKPIGTVLFQVCIDNGRTIALTNLKFSPSSSHILAGYSYRLKNPILRRRAEEYAAALEIAERADTWRRYRASAHRHTCKYAYPGGFHHLDIRPGTSPEQAAALLRYRPACCYDNPTDDGYEQEVAWPERPPQVGVVDLYEPKNGTLELRNSLTADVEVSPNSRRCGTVQDEINIAMFARSATGYGEGIVYGTQKGRVRLFKQRSGAVRREEAGEGRPRRAARELETARAAGAVPL